MKVKLKYLVVILIVVIFGTLIGVVIYNNTVGVSCETVSDCDIYCQIGAINYKKYIFLVEPIPTDESCGISVCENNKCELVRDFP